MGLEIVWTLKAESSFENNINFILSNWTEKEVKSFVQLTFSYIDQISEMPELLFPLSKGNKVRKAVISKHTSLFYRVNTKQIELLYFWDNRMNPDSLTV